jgi:dipeptidyl aminopeptidase/acylaminoacyl peptidase
MAQKKRPIEIEDLARIIDIEDPQVSPDENWVAYVERKIDLFENVYNTNIWLAPTDGGEHIRLTQNNSDSQPRWSPDGQTLAFVSARSGKAQVYLLRLTALGGEAFAITKHANGAHSPVWSPDGAQIAYLAPSDADERLREASTEQDAAPADKLEAKYRKERADAEEALRYDPMIVEQIPYRDGYGKRLLDGRFDQIYVIEPKAGAQPRRLTDMQTNFSVPSWTPDGKALLSWRPSDPKADEPSRLDRLYRISVANGSARPLNDEPYAERNGVASPDGTQIAVVRIPHERQYTRVPHLALMSSEGGSVRDVTLEIDRSVSDPKWVQDDAIYFRLLRDGNTEIVRYNVSANNFDTVVTGPEGDFIEVQGYSVGNQGGVAYVGSLTTVPGELYWLPAGSTTPQRLTHANDALLETLQVQAVTELRYPSYDDSTVQSWYILPVNYEEGKRYPLIVHIHGGPRIMANPASKMFHEWQVYAAKGYVVLFVNAHGSDGYGQKYQAKAYGMNDMPDTMAGVDKLIEMGIVDPERLAVTGGSYGGYATGWIVGNTTRFKAAIAERGVYNLLSHYATTDFPMPTPQELEAEVWEVPMTAWELSPVAHAHKVTTPLMILHSENDFRVLMSEAEQLFSYVRLAGNGTPVQMVRFPREGHNLSRTGEPQHRVRRLELMTGWFEEYNPPDHADEV